MSWKPMQRRTLALVAVILPLLALLAYVALRSGPLAPVAVTVAEVHERTIAPALFGIGTLEARHVYRIGPIFPGRLARLDVQVGDSVAAGTVLGEMAPVDIDDRLRAQEALGNRAEAAIREASARQAYARGQARRYEQLYASRTVSEEAVSAKRQELAVADAALAAARQDLARARSDRDAVATQRGDLQLRAPVAGIVTLREVDPGTTVVAGQAVVELVDPLSLWVNTRFDQASSHGLAAGLAADIVLRSRNGQALPGRVLRLEPKADAITEETLAKVGFDSVPTPLPPIGELAEVTVALAPLAAATVIPNAAIRREGNQAGVWRLVDGEPQFVAVKLGRSDLDGNVQVLEGLAEGDRIVVYSAQALGPRTRIKVVERIPGVD